MTTPSPSRLPFDDPGELVAALPALLTFRPDDSVVLLTYTGARRLELESAIRMDIPAPEHIDDVATQLCLVAVNHEAAMIDMVVVGGAGADPPAVLPARALVERIAADLEHADIGMSHAVWVSGVDPGGTWWCYENPTCTGQIGDPADSPAIAALTPAGAVSFGSRAELAAHLAPDPDAVLARRATLIAARPPGDPHEELRFVRSTVDRIGESIRTDPHHPLPDFDDETIARFATALSTPEVREACLAYTLTIRGPAAELLWTKLTRAVPGPARADPASLLGVSSYLRGDGARAALALEAAQSADPGHPLTETLRHVLGNGLPPRIFRTLIAESFVTAFAHR